MSRHFYERKLNSDAARHDHEEVCLPLVGFGHNAQLDHVEHSRRIREKYGESDQHKFQRKAIFLGFKCFKVDERWVFDANHVEGRLAPM